MLDVARRMTLTQRLVALVAVAILPAGAGLLYFLVSFHNERENEVRDLALRTSQIAALEMERITSGGEGVLRTLALSPSVHWLTSDCGDYLGELVSQLPQYSGFAVADAGGRVRCAAGIEFGPEGVGNKPWFKQALHDDTFIVGTYSETDDGTAYLPVALPIGSGDQGKVAVAGIDLDWLGARLRERDLARGSALAVADRDGIIIAREPDSDSFVGKLISDAFRPFVWSEQPGTAILGSPDGTRRIVGYQPAAATGIDLYVGAGYSTDQVFGTVWASTWRSLFLIAGGAILACLLAWIIGDRLLRRPIRRILSTIASWRAGDESARTGIAPDTGELSALAGAIDGYMDGIADARAARRAEEERRALLLREMNHRIKNILAAVQAIANQTFKDRATTESMRAFSRRLSAMASAHDVLVADDWRSTDLRRTIEAAIEPFAHDRKSRFDLEGPPVQITAQAALSLSMSLHELCTNAAKYGALSVPEGQVTIRWQVDPAATGGRFRLRWVERGGPEVVAPERRGFGTRLIETALAGELGAHARLEYPATGLELEFDADPASILARPERCEGSAA